MDDLPEVEPFFCREQVLGGIWFCEGQGRASAALAGRGGADFFDLKRQKNWGHRGALRLAKADAIIGHVSRQGYPQFAC